MSGGFNVFFIVAPLDGQTAARCRRVCKLWKHWVDQVPRLRELISFHHEHVESDDNSWIYEFGRGMKSVGYEKAISIFYNAFYHLEIAQAKRPTIDSFLAKHGFAVRMFEDDCLETYFNPYNGTFLITFYSSRDFVYIKQKIESLPLKNVLECWKILTGCVQNVCLFLKNPNYPVF